MYCRHCGKELLPNAKFCTDCGNKINTSKYFCRSCGAELTAKEKFCTVCGEKYLSNLRICACGCRVKNDDIYCAECGALIERAKPNAECIAEKVQDTTKESELEAPENEEFEKSDEVIANDKIAEKEQDCQPAEQGEAKKVPSSKEKKTAGMSKKIFRAIFACAALSGITAGLIFGGTYLLDKLEPHTYEEALQKYEAGNFEKYIEYCEEHVEDIKTTDEIVTLVDAIISTGQDMDYGGLYNSIRGQNEKNALIFDMLLEYERSIKYEKDTAEHAYNLACELIDNYPEVGSLPYSIRGLINANKPGKYTAKRACYKAVQLDYSMAEVLCKKSEDKYLEQLETEIDKLYKSGKIKTLSELENLNVSISNLRWRDGFLSMHINIKDRQLSGYAAEDLFYNIGMFSGRYIQATNEQFLSMILETSLTQKYDYWTVKYYGRESYTDDLNPKTLKPYKLTGNRMFVVTACKENGEVIGYFKKVYEIPEE